MLRLKLSLENLHLASARRAQPLLRTCLRQSLPAILADETSNEREALAKLNLCVAKTKSGTRPAAGAKAWRLLIQESTRELSPENQIDCSRF